MLAIRTRTSWSANLCCPADSTALSCALCSCPFLALRKSLDSLDLSSMSASLWRDPASFVLGAGGFTGCPSLRYWTTSRAKTTLAAAPRITWQKFRSHWMSLATEPSHCAKGNNGSGMHKHNVPIRTMPWRTWIALKWFLLAVETPSSIKTTSYCRLKAWKAVDMMQSSVQAPTWPGQAGEILLWFGSNTSSCGNIVNRSSRYLFK